MYIGYDFTQICIGRRARTDPGGNHGLRRVGGEREEADEKRTHGYWMVTLMGLELTPAAVTTRFTLPMPAAEAGIRMLYWSNPE